MRLELPVRPGENLFSSLREAGYYFPSSCGGRGLCGRCKVRVLEGAEALSPPSAAEERLLTPEELSEGWRLACQASVLKEGRLLLELPKPEHQLMLEGLERPVPLRPPAAKASVKLVRPSLEDLRPDVERLFQAVGATRVDLSVLRELPDLLRSGQELHVVVRQGEVLAVRAEDFPLLGLAVDIGTTKLAAYLVDLEAGDLLATVGRVNPQIAYGEDIVSRITFAMREPGGARVLQEVLVKGLNELVEEVCRLAKAEPSDVQEVVCVGNTVMHHTLLGISLAGLGVSPFTPAVAAPLEVKARELGLRVGEGAYIYLPPPIAGFVGSDALADAISSGLHETDETAMLVDIGTNTEVILAHEGELWACSCASGPAFEGWRITCGTRAIRGAIDSVRLDERTGEVVFTTVGGEKPVGICGSGLIDALAELYRAGLLDRTGRMVKRPGLRRLRERPDGVLEFVLAWREEAATDHDVVITQKDVRELQLAKAAIRTGAETLLARAGLSAEDLDVLYLAGAFGSSLNVVSARAIGLCPDVPEERIRFIGNAAGAGARMLLKDVELRREAEELARRVRFVELAVEPDFKEKFLEALAFPAF